MFESALGNLCIVICGMTVLLSAFFIWRTETLPNRLIVAAAAALAACGRPRPGIALKRPPSAAR